MDSTTRILIIDDEKEFTDLLQMQMRRSANVHLRVVNLSTEAVEAARQFKPSLILLDIVMPGLDGGELLHLFEADKDLKEVPIIVVSALTTHDETSSGLTASGHPLIAKPVKTEQLISRIEDQLGHTIRH
ncbi:MAG: two-component system OmpR family response regulator [Verrucomicrobiales bacterium]|jgi:two-component system OmpR family response regulator